MARRSSSRDPSGQLLTSVLRNVPPKYRVWVIAAVCVGLVGWFVWSNWKATRDEHPSHPPSPTETYTDTNGYLFCFWNVENLFDDRDDDRREVDEEFDDAFATDATLRAEKLDRIASTLLRMNGGKGPDVIACVEVESVRAAELLQGELNRKLDAAGADPKLRYTQVAMQNLNAGRHIAPCVITRLPVVPQLTRMHGRQVRVLETHLSVNGHDLCVIASHWTSKLRQRDGSDGEDGRTNYAKLIRGVVDEKARQNPAVDLLVCGDFNDTPESPPVAVSLGATGERARVVPGANPPLLDLLAGKDPKQFGTLYYREPLIYDHVCVSPGLLDGVGWACDPDSVRTVSDDLVRPGATRREPWRFGDPKAAPTGGRGFSDHFPVTVRLTVSP